jgi:hypothetical protein
MNTASQHANDRQLFTNGICVSHIIFDDSEFVTLWATSRIGNALQKVHLVATVAHINEILRHSGTKGEEILLGMANAMLHTETPPYVVDIKQILGHCAVLTACKLNLVPAENSENPQCSEPCYWIDHVQALSQIQQVNNLAQHIRDFGQADTVQVCNKTYNLDLAQLAKQYNYYLGLLELDINDDAARIKSNLSDDRLFAMAKML